MDANYVLYLSLTNPCFFKGSAKSLPKPSSYIWSLKYRLYNYFLILLFVSNVDGAFGFSKGGRSHYAIELMEWTESSVTFLTAGARSIGSFGCSNLSYLLLMIIFKHGLSMLLLLFFITMLGKLFVCIEGEFEYRLFAFSTTGTEVWKGPDCPTGLKLLCF